MRRLIVGVAVAALFLSVIPPAASTPVATSAEEYIAYSRIYPDPHGCHVGEPGYSPYAKGRVCAVDFIRFAEMQDGLRFLEETFPDFVKFYTLHEDFNCKGEPVKDKDKGCQEFMSAGLPVTTGTEGQGYHRDKQPLHMVRITDETVPMKGKRHYVFPLSIHGIERAGVEGGTRAAEDLATWAACEAAGKSGYKKLPDYVDCANEEPIPHPILEATPDKSVMAGEALKKGAVFLIYPNPDGWMRGDRTGGGTQFYQRYNGNGVDLNRDWPEQGFTFRPYTPWSEPETRAFGRVLQGVGPVDARGKPKWDGGIDLHGQLVDRAFSFTLIGGSQRPYDKNQRVLQTVKGAWADAEERLAWSPAIKPNDAPEDDPRVYGVQWGTIWDTIAYTVTGALGNWIDSPIGLNADGIDNEMSLSHVVNCGIGSCFDPHAEQLHVDGNKSLVYSMVNYDLKPESDKFRVKNRVAYVHNRGVIKEKTDRLVTPPKFARLPTQKDIADFELTDDNEYEFRFRVKGPKQDVYNGGIGVTLSCTNVGGVSGCAFSEARLERKKPQEPNTQGEDWETVNSYFNQSPIYAQAGQALHANYPVPGRYRVKIYGSDTQGSFKGDINFTKEKGWPDPGQIGYRVTNMKFWKDLKPFMRPRLGKLTARKIATTNKWQRRFRTIVVTNKVYKGRVAKKLKKWVAKKDGNLVLTDKALRMLPKMGIIKGGVSNFKAYAGYVNFATAKKDATYDDPLARKINQPGAAEGQGGGEDRRRQTYEPVPLGIALQNSEGGDADNSPVWFVEGAAYSKAKGKQRSVGTSGELNQISYGEIKYRGGRIRFIGAVLPMPTEKFDHPFGLGDYAVTYAGYQLLKNVLTWK